MNNFMFMSSLVGKTHEMPMNCFHRYELKLDHALSSCIVEMVHVVKVVDIVGSLHCTVYDAGASVAD